MMIDFVFTGNLEWCHITCKMFHLAMSEKVNSLLKVCSELFTEYGMLYSTFYALMSFAIWPFPESARAFKFGSPAPGMLVNDQT